MIKGLRGPECNRKTQLGDMQALLIHFPFGSAKDWKDYCLRACIFPVSSDKYLSGTTALWHYRADKE